MNVLLLGARGCGKSSIGRRLAEVLSRPFVDLDDVVLASFSEPTVRQVWHVHGEQAWRNAEAVAIDAILVRDGQIVALGGGTPMVAAAHTRIQAAQHGGAARCVYLRCDVAELARRLHIDGGDRPSLTGADPADEIAQILADREPTYRRMADAEVDVTDLPPVEALAAVRDVIEPWVSR